MPAEQENEIQISEPPLTLLSSFYKQSVLNFITYLCKCFNQVNITKSSAVNPHRRKSSMGHIHRLIFTVLGKSFNKDERVEMTKKLVRFHISSVTMIYDIFHKIELCRFHKNGDITIAAPWACINSNYNQNNIEMEQGAVVNIIDFESFNEYGKSICAMCWTRCRNRFYFSMGF